MPLIVSRISSFTLAQVLDTMHARFVDHDTTAETDAAAGAAGTDVATAAGGAVGTDAAATAAGGAAGSNYAVTGTFSAAAAPGEDDDGVRESEASSIDLDEGSGKRNPRCVKKTGLVQAYNHLIRACTSVGGVDVALELVEEMHRRRVVVLGLVRPSGLFFLELFIFLFLLVEGFEIR